MSDLRDEVETVSGGRQRLIAQAAGFALVGALRTVLSYGAYLAILLVAPYWMAFSITYVSFLFASMVVNGKYVFNANVTLRRGVRYGFVYCGNYLLSLGILTLAIKGFGISPPLAPVIVIAVMFPVNWLTERRALTT